MKYVYVFLERDILRSAPAVTSALIHMRNKLHKISLRHDYNLVVLSENTLQVMSCYVSILTLTLLLYFCLFLSPAFWSFMWFVGFCFLANQWQVTNHDDNPLREGGDAARAAITFSFFSIFTWVSRSPPHNTA